MKKTKATKILQGLTTQVLKTSSVDEDGLVHPLVETLEEGAIFVDSQGRSCQVVRNKRGTLYKKDLGKQAGAVKKVSTKELVTSYEDMAERMDREWTKPMANFFRELIKNSARDPQEPFRVQELMPEFNHLFTDAARKALAYPLPPGTSTMFVEPVPIVAKCFNCQGTGYVSTNSFGLRERVPCGNCMVTGYAETGDHWEKLYMTAFLGVTVKNSHQREEALLALVNVVNDLAARGWMKGRMVPLSSIPLFTADMKYDEAIVIFPYVEALHLDEVKALYPRFVTVEGAKPLAWGEVPNG